MRGLRTKLALAFIGIASGIVLIASLFLIFETHYHVSMYQKSILSIQTHIELLTSHFEQAIIQSIVLTTLAAILLAIFVSLYVSNRIIAPLIKMMEVAEQMASGNLQVRVSMTGKDELGDLANSLNQLAKQLQKQEELRKNMTSDIAHELRTPLATLKSHMEAMLDGVWEPTLKRIQSCHEEIERLIRLVSDLEQLNYLEEPEFALQLSKEDLTNIVKNAVETAKPAFFQKRIQLQMNEAEPIWVRVDRSRVQQIFHNLLSNALKFTPSGGNVSINIHDQPEKVTIQIKDTGIGIPQSEIPNLFERLYRVDKSRNREFGGSGLGLTIVKRLTEAHGGSVWIESEEGIGSTVFVTLPK